MASLDPEHAKRLGKPKGVKEIMAGYNYVTSVLDTADDKHALMWHGWALREAFLAGISYAKSKK